MQVQNRGQSGVFSAIAGSSPPHGRCRKNRGQSVVFFRVIGRAQARRMGGAACACRAQASAPLVINAQGNDFSATAGLSPPYGEDNRLLPLDPETPAHRPPRWVRKRAHPPARLSSGRTPKGRLGCLVIGYSENVSLVASNSPQAAHQRFGPVWSFISLSDTLVAQWLQSAMRFSFSSAL